MKSLDVLCSGIRGAENGSVNIYVRGTTTRAQVFADYDGTGAQTPIAALPLDANGGAVWYVNQPVLCRAYSSSGAVVREFTAFETATDTECISTSFTGTNYGTGQSGVFNPVLLSSILDKVVTSFGAGAVDWNVIVDGSFTSKTLTNAIRAVSGMWFNVKDPAYGAKGDGVTDDRSSIQAAITASDAVGGLVFFPPGNYIVGAPGLTVTGSAGFFAPNGAIMTSTAAGIQQLSIGPGTSAKFMIVGLRFSNTGSAAKWLTLNNGDLLLVGVVGTFTDAGVAAVKNVINFTGPADALTAIDCRFAIAPSGAFASASILVNTISALYCEFNAAGGGGLFDLIAAKDGIIAGCDFTSSTTIQSYIYHNSSTAALTVTGCDFANASAGSVQQALIDITGGVNLFEYGNTFSVVPAPLVAVGITNFSDATCQWGQLASVEHRESFATDNTTPVTLFQTVSCYRIRRTTATNQTLNIGVPVMPHQALTLTIINDSAGAPVETLTTIKGLASVNPAAGTRTTITAKAVLVAGTLAWVLVSNTNWT